MQNKVPKYGFEIACVCDCRNAEGSKQSMNLKDALRDTCIKEIADAWYQLASVYQSQQPEVASEVLSTVQRYISWMDIRLVANDRWVVLAAEKCCWVHLAQFAKGFTCARSSFEYSFYDIFDALVR